jgi:hypothetical protein
MMKLILLGSILLFEGGVCEGTKMSQSLFEGYYCFMLFTKLKPRLIDTFKEVVTEKSNSQTDFKKLSHKFTLFTMTQCRRNIQNLTEKQVFAKIYNALTNENFHIEQNSITLDKHLLSFEIFQEITDAEMNTEMLMEELKRMSQVF